MGKLRIVIVAAIAVAAFAEQPARAALPAGTNIDWRIMGDTYGFGGDWQHGLSVTANFEQTDGVVRRNSVCLYVDLASGFSDGGCFDAQFRIAPDHNGFSGVSGTDEPDGAWAWGSGYSVYGTGRHFTFRVLIREPDDHGHYCAPMDGGGRECFGAWRTVTITAAGDDLPAMTQTLTRGWPFSGAGSWDISTGYPA
jgi:hypothetical protein